jgi:hypothetical protein
MNMYTAKGWSKQTTNKNNQKKIRGQISPLIKNSGGRGGVDIRIVEVKIKIGYHVILPTHT